MPTSLGRSAGTFTGTRPTLKTKRMDLRVAEGGAEKDVRMCFSFVERTGFNDGDAPYSLKSQINLN